MLLLACPRSTTWCFALLSVCSSMRELVWHADLQLLVPHRDMPFSPDPARCWSAALKQAMSCSRFVVNLKCGGQQSHMS